MNEKCQIIVSEPWDYENSEGKNLITGRILKRVGTRGFVFLSDTPLEIDGSVRNILLLSNRFEYTNDIPEKESLAVNGGVLTIDYHDGLTEETLRQNSKFIIIGDLKKMRR